MSLGDYMCIMEHYSTKKRREALALPTMWTDPENRMLSERSKHRKTHRA